MKIEEGQISGITVLQPRGPLIDADVDQLKGRFANVRDYNPGRVILDASAMAFVDSHGLEMLVDASEEIAGAGGRLKIAGSNETLREVMELTEVTQLFEFFDDVDLAVGSFE